MSAVATKGLATTAPSRSDRGERAAALASSRARQRCLDPGCATGGSTRSAPGNCACDLALAPKPWGPARSRISYASRTETLTFLFTDIEGSTSLLKRVSHEGYVRVLAEHHRLIRAGISAHGGKEMDTQGDGFFAVFASASACAAASIQMQLELRAHEWPAGEPVRVRMGMHSGEASREDTGLVGLSVHRAARVAAVAHGGQILLSETAAALLRDSLPAGGSLLDLGPHRLKDLGQAERIFQLQAEGLPSEFPALRSLDNPALANNLPAQSARFIGREQELEEVRALILTSRLITMTGAGGSGKTRLALRIAADLLDGTGDGVWLVELASVSAEDAVVSTITETLGIKARPGRSELETLLDALGPQQTLIVMDNCEHLIGICATVADAILRSCPQVHLVATSREPLGIAGETIYRVPSLSLPDLDQDSPSTLARSDAVALFLERARSQGVHLVLDDEAGPLVASTCRRLDGMPLAIELAAARLRSLSLASLHGLLDKRFRLLTGGSRSALERQQTLRATVDWSYSLLGGPERSVLRRLSVFAEGFDLEAAGAVCAFAGIEAFDVTDILGSLVDKSLVVAEPAQRSLRYRLLETIRQFAAERLVELDESEAATVAAAHCQHFLTLAETAAPHLTGPQGGRWLAQLDDDQANLRRAIEHAAEEPEQSSVVLRFAVALTYYWTTRALRRDGFALLMPVLELPAAREEPRLFARALVTGAACALFIDRARAQRLAEQAVELARQLDDESLLVLSQGVVGAAHYFAGDLATAFALAEDCVDRARSPGGGNLLAESLLLCCLCSQVIDPTRTEALYAETIAYAQRSGDLLLTADVHNNAGVRALEAANLTAARDHLERAANASREIGAAPHYANIGLGMLLREEGNSDSARSMLEDALRASRRTGDLSGVAYSSLGLACLAGDLAEWPRSAQLHGAAQAFLEQIGQPWLRYDQIRQASIDTVQTGLGEAEFERSYAAGRALSFSQAIDLALRRAEPGGAVGAVADRT